MIYIIVNDVKRQQSNPNGKSLKQSHQVKEYGELYSFRQNISGNLISKIKRSMNNCNGLEHASEW